METMKVTPDDIAGRSLKYDDCKRHSDGLFYPADDYDWRGLIAGSVPSPRQESARAEERARELRVEAAYKLRNPQRTRGVISWFLETFLGVKAPQDIPAFFTRTGSAEPEENDANWSQWISAPHDGSCPILWAMNGDWEVRTLFGEHTGTAVPAYVADFRDIDQYRYRLSAKPDDVDQWVKDNSWCLN